MKFNITVYCQRTLFLLLIILYLFGECAVNPPKSTFPKQYATDINNLTKLVSVMDNIVTWKSLVRDVRRNESIPVPMNKSEDEIIKYVFKRINDKLYDLQCTHAYFAKNHVILIHSLVDKDLLTENTFEAVQSLKKIYYPIAIKTYDTFINLGYQPPNWLRHFTKFLSQVELFNYTFHEELYRIIDILKTVTSRPSCDGDLILTGMAGVSQTLPDIYVDWMVLNSQLNYFLNVHFWCSINTNKLLVDNVVESELWKQISIPSGRISEDYMYENFREISARVKQNLIWGSNYVLHANRTILSYNTTHFDPFIMFHKRKIERSIGVVPEKIRPITVNKSNKSYADELSKIDIRIVRGVSLLKIRIWGYPVKKEIIASALQTPAQFNMNYYRDRFCLFNRLTNEIMDNLNCVYAFHAHIHLTEMLALFNLMVMSPYHRAKYFSANVDLAFKYFDITLKMMATFYNENYVPAGWMVLLVLYLERIRTLYANGEEFVTDTQEIIRNLQNSCDQCSQQSMAMHLPLQEIQEEYDHTNFQMFMRLQRELTGIKYNDFVRYENVSSIYTNLMQITYFLDMNSAVLQYSNYKEFHPSKWFFDSIELTDNTLHHFRWDTLRYEMGKSDWTTSNTTIIEFIKSNSNQKETDVIQRISNSSALFFKIFNLIAGAVIRLVVSFLIQCNEIRTSTLSESLFNANYETLFKTNCIGIAKPVKELFDILRISDQDSFYTTLSIELFNYEYMVENINTLKIETTGFKRLIDLCIVKLHAISISESLKVDIPFELMSVTEETLVTNRVESVWTQLGILRNRAKNILTNYNIDLKPTFGDLRKRRLFVSSINVLWPHAIHVDEFTIPPPDYGTSNINNYIHHDTSSTLDDFFEK